METVLFDEGYVRVIYDDEMKLGKVVWSGNPDNEQYKKPFLALLEHAKNGYPVLRFLSDTRGQGIVNPENRKWFEKEMVPAALDKGLKRAAVISGGNAFKLYYLNMILSAVNKFDMPFKIFKDEEKAIDFLMEE